MFLTDVFNNIILKDRSRYVAPRVNTRDQEYPNFALAGVGALLLLACLLWANSWRHNRDLLNRMQSAVEGVHVYRTDASSYEGALADLDSMRSPLTTLLHYERNGPPLSYRWGLYSGNDLVDSVSGLYFARFRSVFISPLLASLTSRFLQLDRTLLLATTSIRFKSVPDDYVGAVQTGCRIPWQLPHPDMGRFGAASSIRGWCPGTSKCSSTFPSC